MTIYYVSPHGSDANNGLGPDASHASNKPWLTIGKALGAAGIASGDTVHIGPGTYREVVTVAMISATVDTFVLGDPWNNQGFKNGSGVLLTPAEIIWTAYLTNDTTAPSATTLLNLNGRDFLIFQYITFIGGSGNPSNIASPTATSINITFRDCKIISASTSNGILTFTCGADVSCNWVIDRCRFLVYAGSCIVITLTTSALADYDTNFLVQNSEIISYASATVAGCVQVSATGAAAFKGGGVIVKNCHLFARSAGLLVNSANISTSIPCTCNNSLLISGGGGALSANTLGQITENYNRIIAATPRTNVTAGANSIADMSHAPLLDLGFARQLGFAPQPYWGPMANSPLLGFGNTGAPSVDILNRARPAGGQSLLNAVGAYERHDTAVKEISIVQAGSSAIKIIGPGDHDFHIPVNAVSTIISLYARYDTNHGAGTKPQAILLANGALGVATETKTMTSGIDTWEQLTFSAFTPNAKGFVTIRFIARPTAANGIAYFDTIAGGANSTAEFDHFPIDTLIAAVASGGGAGSKLRGLVS